jgi:hypothetical protein
MKNGLQRLAVLRKKLPLTFPSPPTDNHRRTAPVLAHCRDKRKKVLGSLVLKHARGHSRA